MADWYVGMSIRCVTHSPRCRGRLGFEKWPVIGDEYKIRAIDPVRFGWTLLLEGLINPRYSYAEGTREVHFRVAWFRPSISQDADISQFTSLLDNLPVHEIIDA